MSDIAKQLGRHIRTLRTGLGISQEELAFKAGLSAAHLGQIERAVKKPTVDTIEKIASSLQVSVAELFSFEEKAMVESEAATINKIVAQLSSMTEEQQWDILKLIKVFKDYRAE